MKNILAALACAVLAAGCTTIDRTREVRLDPAAKWVLLPMTNLTETPQAGLRAEAILGTLMRNAGIAQWETYPATLNPDGLFDPTERKAQDQAMAWAKAQKARFALGGSVQEWRYKVGVDGEPAVGLALQIIDLKDGSVVWSSVGAKSGWSREALSAVAQKLIRDLLASARIE